MSGDLTQNLVVQTLQEILTRLGVMETQMTGLQTQIAGVKTQIASLQTQTDGLDTRLQALEAKQYDTKPIWERVLAELVEINRRLDSLDRRFSVLNDDVLETRADQRKLEERLASLERPRS